MRRPKPPEPHNRDGIWYLIRRVPKEFAHLDRRGIVRISTEIAVTHDPKQVRAKGMVRQLDLELQAYWRGLVDGQSAEARRRFDAASKRARSLNLPYSTAQELSEGHIADILARVRLLANADRIEDEQEVAAVLGGENRPTLKLSELLPEFESLHSARLAQKSADQVRKWRNPKLRAVGNLISVVTDKALHDLTRADGVTFRRWWQDRIAGDGYDIALLQRRETSRTGRPAVSAERCCGDGRSCLL